MAIRQLRWGQTPWDNLSTEELLATLQDMRRAVTIVASFCRTLSEREPSLYWSEGVGGKALEMVRQVAPLLDETLQLPGRILLLRSVQKMGYTLIALYYVGLMGESMNPVPWAHGSGAEAMQIARQIIDPLDRTYGLDRIYDVFFAYAKDLLFEQSVYEIRTGWVICPSCGEMWGSLHHTRFGQLCSRCGKSHYRLLTWEDMQPK